MNELILIAAGALVSGITQFLKRYTDFNPLVVAASLSILGGLGYAALELTGYWQAVKAFVVVAWPISVLLYETIKQTQKAAQPPKQ